MQELRDLAGRYPTNPDVGLTLVIGMVALCVRSETGRAEALTLLQESDQVLLGLQIGTPFDSWMDGLHVREALEPVAIAHLLELASNVFEKTHPVIELLAELSKSDLK